MSGSGISNAVAAVLLVIVPTSASPLELETVFGGGDSVERINVLIMGDGYTAADQAQLSRDARRIWGGVVRVSPYAELAGIFSVKLLHVISKEHDASFGTDGQRHDTALHSEYGCAGIDRLVCVDERLVSLLAAENDPAHDAVIVIANDHKYGGSSSGVVSVVSLANDFTVPHEFGHLLGGLADEYETPENAPPCGGSQDCPEPNVTTITDRETLKWLAWVAPSVPVPTPAGKGMTGIGLFDGARHVSHGVYRPQEKGCLMRDGQRAFCAVCREAIFRRAIGQVPLIQAPDPPIPATVSQDAPCRTTAFSVTLAPVCGGRYSTTWTIDGVPAATDTTTLTVPPGTLTPGRHTVDIAVQFASDLLRIGGNTLSASGGWVLDIGPSCATSSPSEALASRAPDVASSGGIVVNCLTAAAEQAPAENPTGCSSSGTGALCGGFGALLIATILRRRSR
ncbi:MAG: M64 family metallopeptidase [Myxococcales bacterium]